MFQTQSYSFFFKDLLQILSLLESDERQKSARPGQEPDVDSDGGLHQLDQLSRASRADTLPLHYWSNFHSLKKKAIS